MEENGGFATLGYLNQKVLQLPGFESDAESPFANIRRIVQNKRFFFKIRPGLWALKSHQTKLPFDVLPHRNADKEKIKAVGHSYYQGLLVQIGRLKKYATFVPNQDKNKPFLGKTLWDVSSQENFYKFGYDHITKKAQTVDVCWFNDRKMPSWFFEVEHSTDFQNSLLKFFELQDYSARFFVVADRAREAEYHKKINASVFKPIRKRVGFMDYNFVSTWHAKSFALNVTEGDIFD